MKKLPSGERYVKLFQGLHNSRVGSTLCEYLTELVDYLCDIRTMGDNEVDRKARLAAAELLEEHILRRIKLSDTGQGTDPTQWE